MKTLFPTLVAVHLALASGDLVAAEPVDLRSCQTNVQAQFASFKASDDHSHLIKAYRAVFLDPIRPEATNFMEAVLVLKLQVVQECYRARDFDYDVKADHGVTTKVSPPLDSGQMVVAGMDPKLITNAVARQKYEAAIEENNRRGAKLHRELELQRAIDHGVFLIRGEITSQPKESAAARRLVELVERTITEQGLKETLLKQVKATDGR